MKLLRVLKSYSLVIYMVLILSIFLIDKVSAAPIYYVSPNGNDTNSTINAPLKTIQKRPTLSIREIRES